MHIYVQTFIAGCVSAPPAGIEADPSSPTPAATAEATATAAPPALCGPGDPFGPEALAADIAYLASDDLAGRAPDTPGDEAALDHIAARFRCLGLEPAGRGAGSYLQPFVTSDG